MKKYVYLFVALLTVLFLSCTDHHSIPTQKLKSVLSIGQLSDSSFLSDIRSLFFYKGKYFVSDFKRDQIFILNRHLELEKILGSKGRGPGEFIGASHLFVSQDSLFIINAYKRAIEVFDYHHHLKTIDIPLEGRHRYTSDIRFCIQNRKILLTAPNENSSILVFPFDSDTVTRFGKVKKYRTPEETRIKNKRHLCVMGDKIVAISDCLPTIEIYNRKGQLLMDYNFEEIDFVKKILQFAGKKKKQINSYYQIVQDAYIFENQIFLLALSLDKNDKIKKNRIIQLEVTKDKIVPKKIFYLGNNWFGSICVSKEHILAFNNTTSELTLFRYE